MTWQLLLAIYLLLNTLTYLLQRKLGQNFGRYKRLISAIFFVVFHYPAGILVAIYSSPRLSIGWLNVVFLLIGSWVFPLVNVIALKASKHVDAGHYAVLSNLTPIVTIIAATLLLKEELNHRQLLGAVIIIAAAFLVTAPHLRRRNRDKAPALALALVGFLLIGVATVYERWMLNRIGIGAYLLFGWGAQALWMIVISWPERQHIKILRHKKHLLPIVGYALAGSVKGICFIVALKLCGNASLFSVVISLTPILVVPAAYFILKETRRLRLKLTAAAGATIGLIILNIA